MVGLPASWNLRELACETSSLPQGFPCSFILTILKTVPKVVEVSKNLLLIFATFSFSGGSDSVGWLQRKQLCEYRVPSGTSPPHTFFGAQNCHIKHGRSSPGRGTGGALSAVHFMWQPGTEWLLSVRQGISR